MPCRLMHVLSFALSVPWMVLAQPFEQHSTLGTFVTIDVPGASRSQARYLNSRGDIVGFFTAAGAVHGFLRSNDGELTTIDFPGADFTMAVGINSEGDIVGLYGIGVTQHGFLRTRDGAFSSASPRGRTIDARSYRRR